MQLLYASISVTLTPSSYNGSHISCFGAQDGSITANPVGGSAPYTYTWSNNETTQTITGLAAGYYRVEVKDAFGAIVYGEITLVEPEALAIEPLVYEYGNGYNISCWSCSNGVIDIYVDNGTTPYTFLWNDGNTNQSRTNLSPGTHYVTVTDANGCTINSEQLYLREPERSDWTISGNSGSNPSTNFIGTTDSVALILKTNNADRLKVNANGDIAIKSLLGNGIKMIYADSNGVLRAGNYNTNTICNASQPPAWFTGLNGATKTLWTCPDVIVGIGTLNPITRLHVAGDAVFTGNTGTVTSAPFIRGKDDFSNSSASTPDYTWWNNDQTGIFHPASDVIAFTNGGTESMRIVKDASGNLIVGIGLNPATQSYVASSTPYKLMVAGKIGARDVVVRNATLAWPDYVFNKEYKLLPLDEIETFIKQYKHLPEIPSAIDIANNGQEMGRLQVLQQKKIEDIYLYLINLEKRINQLEKENDLLKK